MVRSADIRFEEKYIPEPNSGCWLWTATCTHDGYGQFTPQKNDKAMAHRWSYERFVGPIPSGLQLDHLCRVRCCVNPQHLEPVTNRENHRRGKWATQTHCINGHSLQDAYVWRNERRCRQCNRERGKAWYHANRKKRAVQ